MRKASAVLGEMIDALNAARACCVGKSIDEFRQDWMARLAAERAIEILSEAARHLQPAITDRHPDIAWPKIRAIGNVLRHEYYRIAANIIWDVINGGELDALDVVLHEELAMLTDEE